MIRTSVDALNTHLLLAGLPAQGGGGGGQPGPPPVLKGPAAPPGFQQILQIGGYLQWGALIACAVAFMAGVIAFTAGRVIDNRHYGKTGAMMMISSIGGALLFAIGPQFITTFSGTG